MQTSDDTLAARTEKYNEVAELQKENFTELDELFKDIKKANASRKKAKKQEWLNNLTTLKEKREFYVLKVD